MTRLNGPYIEWLAIVVAVAVLGNVLYHLVIEPLFKAWWPVVAGWVGW